MSPNHNVHHLPPPSANANRVRVNPVNSAMVARLRDPRVARAMLQQQQQEQHQMQMQQHQQQQIAQLHLQQQQQQAFIASTRIPMRNLTAQSTLTAIDPLTSSEQHAQILAELDVGGKDIREQKQRIAHKSTPARSNSTTNTRSGSLKPVSPTSTTNSRTKVSPRGTTKTTASSNSTKSSSSVRDRSERSRSSSTTRRTSSDGIAERKKTRTNSTSSGSTKTHDQRSPKRSTNDSNTDSPSPTKNIRSNKNLNDSTHSAVDEKSKDTTKYVNFKHKQRPSDIIQQHQIKSHYYYYCIHGPAFPASSHFIVVDRLICLLMKRMKFVVNSVGDQIPKNRCRFFIVF